MRSILIVMAFVFFVAACGKKAPLRPPEDPETSAVSLYSGSENGAEFFLGHVFEPENRPHFS